MSFPASIPTWNNLSIIHERTLPPRSSFLYYTTEADAVSGDESKAKVKSLSGDTWRFHHADSPFNAPIDFQAIGYDSSDWKTVQVPGMWQLQGYGKPQYTNVMYPFPVDPPNVPFASNETGSYLRKFTVPESFANHQLRLRFEGVDSAFKVWINGSYVGYSQGSRNPAEFDISSLVDIKTENSLAVQVYQWCNGSWIEDQDQWWLSGIFRDVNLLAFPKVHIQDFHVKTLLDEQYENAILDVKIELNTDSKVDLKLLDQDRQTILNASKASSGSLVYFKLPVQNPQKWTCETPYLFILILKVDDAILSQRIGFRSTEIKDGLFLVNGKRVVFRGVNRHEHHPESGRTVPFEFLKADLLLMKAYNINAIRTSHQPNDIRLYDLADELGFWVMDEADLECHGFAAVDEESLSDVQKRLSFNEKKDLIYSGAARWTSDNPEWEASYVDRAHQLVARDKNHASVIMWSLGNEAFYGKNFQKMYDYIRSVDDTRVIHYEGDTEARTVDLYSKMYPEVQEIIKFATKEDNSEKPLILCEFIHAMGNGPGGIKEYIDVFYKYPRIQGGFAWEWANHGLKTLLSTGEEYMAYGGDFWCGDQPEDGKFIIDGLVFSDHSPTPGLIEYKKSIEPVQVLRGSASSIEIVNRYDFIALDHLKCMWSIVSDGFIQPGGEIRIPAAILPGQTAELSIPTVHRTEVLSESYLEVSFSLKSGTAWAPAGHEIAWCQIPLSSPKDLRSITPKSTSTPNHTQISPTTLSITSATNTWVMDLLSGTLSSWTKLSSPANLLSLGPTMDFYRALTDNDVVDGLEWKNKRLHQTKEYIRSITWVEDTATKSLIVTVEKRIAPPVLEWSIDTITTHTFSSDGLLIKVVGRPQGTNLPKTFARIGLTFALSKEASHDCYVEWFGRGPGESYNDKKLSQRFGNWRASVDDLWTEYEAPQESANRTDVRWVKVGGKDSTLKASFGDFEGASFMASRYTTRDLDKAAHPYELHKNKKEEVIVRLDWKHHGLGTGICGPKTMEQYRLESSDFEFEVLLE